MSGESHKIWDERSALGGLRPVIDPADKSGRKNDYLDYLQKMVLSRHLSLNGSETMLDFGTGVGRLANWLSRYAGAVVGVDVSQEMLTTADEWKAENVKFVHYDGYTLPFEDDFFDLIVSVWVVQCVTDEEQLKKLTAEMARVLKPGGRIILIEQTAKKRRDYAGLENYAVIRTIDDYIKLFARSRLKERTAYPIRVGGTPTQLATIMRIPLTRALIPILARIEIRLASLRGTPRRGYKDFFFMFQKAID